MNDHFAEMVLTGVVAEPLFPQISFNEDGDCVECLVSSETFYSDRVDDVLTAYYGEDSGDLVGCLIKGVQKLAQKLTEENPGFAVEVEDGSVKLVALFTLRMWKSTDRPLFKKYKKVRDLLIEYSPEQRVLVHA